MNILLIGNGFDLAHDLPTKYIHFLEWVVAEWGLFTVLKKQNSEITSYKETINLKVPEDKQRKSKIDKRIEHQKELWDCIEDNIWIEYFLQCNTYERENWIDFESEISNVIQKLDKKRIGLNDVIKKLPNKVLNELYIEKYFSIGKETTYKKVREKLYKDLNRLTRALEIYLDEALRDHQISVISPDINAIKIDAVLSFNYTDTYRRLYDKENKIQYDFIHGKADSNRTIEYNNMVLGIDEYLPEDRRNKDVEFIAFKKFYQRIYKETGSKYKEWVDKIRMSFIASKKNKQDSLDMMKKLYNSPENQQNMMLWYLMYQKNNNVEWNNLYIFGHSLDVTDGDVLRDLILNDNVYTTIFYLNKDVMGQQIANLVRVIGQDELIRRTGGSTKTIEFKQQQDMITM